MSSVIRSGRGDFSTDQRFLQLSGLALVIGALCSVVALVLLKLISFFTNLFFFQRISLESISPAQNGLGLWVIVVPAIGGLIIGLMARYGSEKIRGHGIPEALEAILFGGSIMQPKVALLKPISSAVSIGSGGPFGAEGPIIMTGGAVGSLISQLFHLTASERKTLLVAGAAAGMSAVFASPIASVLLAVELLLFEWRPRSLIPVAVASITASVLRPLVLGGSVPIFPISAHASLTAVGVIACCAVGLAAGLFSAAVSALLYKVEDLFHRLPFHWMWWCVIGGLVVGVGGYFQPRALGVGYDVIDELLHGDVMVRAALALLVVKSLIWVISLGSGTSGGVLAPLLMMGCGLGVVESLVLPVELKALYPLISMAAIMGGMMRSPFTAVIFALELTHDIDALVPAMTATIVAYGVTVVIMKRSILTEKVARRGYDIFREYGVDPLESVRVSEVCTRQVITLSPSQSRESLEKSHFNGTSKPRGYPVVDEKGRLLGIITASDLLASRLRGDDPVTAVGDLLKSGVETVFPHQSLRDAAERMASLEVGRLPVIEADGSGRLFGIITRSDLLKPRLHHHLLENRRERILVRT